MKASPSNSEKLFLTKTTKKLRPGISLFGHFTAEIGLGQAARNLSYAVDASRIPCSVIDFRLSDRMTEVEFFSKVESFYDTKLNLTVLGANTLQQFQAFRAGRRNILYPYWELKKLPAGTAEFLSKFDEIWAPSRFISTIFKSVPGLKVSVVPQVVLTPVDVKPLSSNVTPFRVFTFFDVESFAMRKNPVGAVRSFQLAFPPGDDSVEFTIKIRGNGGHETRQWLQSIAANDPRIRLIDQTLTRVQLAQLVRECHVFISLHRSEGFGFGPAEALAEGRAVISTDYSGTTDFITPETGYPVDYKMVKLKEGEYPDWEGQEWAEPSIEHAAQHLRNIRSNLGATSAKAMRGRKLLQDKFSPEAVGALIKEKIAAYL